MKNLIFKFYDVDLATGREAIHDPIGWNEDLTKYARSQKYWGIIPEMSIPLQFVKEDADYLRSIYYSRALKADILLKVYKRNIYTNVFEIRYTGKLNFAEAIDSLSTFEIMCIDNGAAYKIKLYENQKYDIGIKSTDKLLFDGLTGNFETVTQMSRVNNVDQYWYNPNNPYTVIYRGFMGNHNFKDVNSGYLDIKYDSADGCNIECLKPCLVDVNTIVSSRCFKLYFYNNPYDYNMDVYEEIHLITALGVETVVAEIAHHTCLVHSGDTVEFLPNYYNVSTGKISMGVGDKLAYSLRWSVYAGTYVQLIYKTEIGDIEQSIKIYAPLAPIETYVTTPKALFTSIMHEITPGTPIVSSLLDDLSDIDTVNKKFIALFSPRNAFRFIDAEGNFYSNDTITTSLNDFWAWLMKSGYMPCLFITNDGTQDTIHVELLSEMLDTTGTAIDMGEVKDLRVSSTIDLIPNKIKVGFSDYTYGFEFGQQEPISNIEFKTPQEMIVQDLDLIESVYRMDNAAFDYVRKLHIDQLYATQPSDENYTENMANIAGMTDILAMDCVFYHTVAGENIYKLRREITVTDDTFNHPTEAFNLDYTAKRCLNRKESYLSAILMFFEGDDLIVTKKPKYELFKSSIDGVEIVENSDHEITGNDPMFMPFYFNLTAKLTDDFDTLLKNNPNSLIKFLWKDLYFYGFVFELSKNLAFNNQSSVKLLMANNNNLSYLL